MATEASRLLALQAELGRLLLGTDTLQEMLARCTEVMAKLLDASFVRIWTLNERENVLELQASSGMYTHLNGPHSRIQVGQYKIGQIAQERLPHLTNKVIGDPRVSDQDWAIREGMKSFAGYPLMVEDQLLGVLGMFSRKELPPATIDAIGAAANFIALGIRRKMSEESLQASEEFSRRVLASSSECIKILDLDYHIKYMNPGGMKALEIDDFGSCENADWCSFWKEEDQPTVTAAIKEALAGRIGNFHAFCKTFKGTPKWWDVVVSPIRNADGKVVKLLASSRDVTERKRAEAVEKENAEQLSAMVDERTANLSREVDERKKAESDLRKLSSQLLTLRDVERRRIARDLHDSLGQILTAATISVAMIDRQRASLDAKAQKAVDDTTDMLQQAMKEVRVVSQLLHPPLLDEAGIGPALQIYTEGISARGDLQVELLIDDNFERLPLELETTIFRIVQECLTNVHRHSGSKKATVRVARVGKEINVQVSDQGRGIETHEASGVGLRGMRERIAQVQGTLTIKSGSDGTTIEARLPAAEFKDGSKEVPGPLLI
jgi:PAS domain S-box